MHSFYSLSSKVEQHSSKVFTSVQIRKRIPMLYKNTSEKNDIK